jgi:predicted dinucleotide-binding enzyme
MGLSLIIGASTDPHPGWVWGGVIIAIIGIFLIFAGLGWPEETSPTGEKTMKIQKIGIVGSGHIGGTLGTLFAKAGYEVFFSSRHPETLEDLAKEAGPKARAGTVREAIGFGDVILMSLPMKAFRELDTETKEALKGKVVIDTSNPYPDRDGEIAEEAKKEAGGTGPFVARLLPGTRIVRAFNTVYFEDLRKTVNEKGERIAIPIASDDEEGLAAAMELAENAGLEPVVVGGLATSKMFDVGTSVYTTSASAKEIRERLHLKEEVKAGA